MELIKTKEILARLYNKYSLALKDAKKDIKPNYSMRGIGGSSYEGIDDHDRDFIYSAIGGLSASVSSSDGPIAFDLEHYITEKEAVKELNELKNHIEKDLKKLRVLVDKYQTRDHYPYPLQVCLSYHEEINNLLNEIYNSDEFKEFDKPGTIDKLKTENLDLKFNNHWRKKRIKYIIHFIAFIPFILIASWMFIHRDRQDLLSNAGKVTVLVASSLITIVFNIFFNNHISFKEAWKILFKKSRQELMIKEKNEFLKISSKNK